MKYQITFLISAFAAVLTILVGLFSGVGFYALLYRGLISFIAFGVCGWLIGTAIQKLLRSIIKKDKTKGNTIDITAQEEIPEDVQTASFSPLNPDMYERFSSHQ